MPKRVFISADHGTAVIYFLQSDLVATLLEAGVEVIVLTDDEVRDQIAARFGRPGLAFEGLRLREAAQYSRSVMPRLQWLIGYLRRVGGSWRVNTAAMDSHVWEVWSEHSWLFRLGMWLPAALAMLVLRSLPLARAGLVRLQDRFRPLPALYTDLFAKYRPDLVLAATPGWRLDRYLLREAGHLRVPTAAAVVGWDNPSSYSIPGASTRWITCWSEAQKDELVHGSDWAPEHVHVGGVPSYDGYLRKTWAMPRESYYRLHGLDPGRALVSYACSFVHFAPNYPNIEALARLISADALPRPSQLLVRLHPSHFQDRPRIFAEERARVEALEARYPHVHVVKPVPLGGSLGYYGGEDMDEKASMMTHSDVVATVYSTMLVETAIHDTPMIAVVIDAPGGWNVPRKYSLALDRIADWPTHRRFRQAGAGRMAHNESELRELLGLYLANPTLDSAERRKFVENEITYTDGTAGRRTANFVLGILGA